jgi:cytochrome c peroxidase
MQKKIESILNKHEHTFNKNLPVEELEKRAKLANLLKKKKGKKVMGNHDDSCKNRIADIVFAYNNEKLIMLLKKRGAAIKYLKFDEMRKIEQEIDDLKKSKNEFE